MASRRRSGDRLEALRVELRSRGLRATPARLAVLGAVWRTEVPLSVSDVVRRLANRKLDRATIFRTLVTLTRVQLLRRLDPGDRIWRFTRDTPSAWRADFVCTACGAVTLLDRVSLAVVGSRVPRAIREREIDVHVRGTCDRCR